ncbi:MAG: DUF4405 domain-containing protein [Actinobacteria bacterium]|nr:DUF4405 domain-containing protein [Actinomycetota bacterium]
MRLKIKIKFFIDILLFVAGLVSAGTGAALLFGPSGNGTHGGLRAATSFLEFSSRGTLRLFHDWSSLILIALVIFHLMLNWGTITCYFKNSFKKKMDRCQNES